MSFLDSLSLSGFFRFLLESIEEEVVGVDDIEEEVGLEDIVSRDSYVGLVSTMKKDVF